ncbi:MAG: hypothetical protein D6705_15685 [Deltaproteobacteria bacterium]|nr:MAG: hypothetical protein D6705_15685 [Deltaproteobacteria bacterium]
MSGRRAELRSFLRGCDVPVRVLDRDPTGASWLPEHLRPWALEDPGAQAEIRRFVEAERCLSELARPMEEAMFVTDVMARVEREGREDVRPCLRATVLFAAHLAAVVLGVYALGWAFPDAGRYVETAQTSIEDAAAWAAAAWFDVADGLVLAAAGLVAVLGAVALRYARRGRMPHTSGA